jgi:acetyl-CoA C-acetyltransferase
MSINQNIVIVSACRTAIGDFQGTLKDVHPRELGRTVGVEALKRAGIAPEAVDEIVCGNVIQAGVGGNIARQIQAELGVPWLAPACTVNQLCASAMRAFEVGCHNIMLGKTDTCLVLGVENMSFSPYLIPKARQGYRMGNGTIEDAMLLDALVCSVENYHMGVTAENVAARYNISRAEQDSHGALSQKHACAAIKAGKFKDEIVPVAVRQKKGTVLFDTDEHPREGTTVEVLAGLRTAFKKDGTVTAGNASGVNDGAAAVVLMSAEKARELGRPALARVVTTVSAGVEPSHMGLGPAVAVPKALRQAGVSYADIGYWELHEAFAAQFIGVQRKLKEDHGVELDMEKVNRNGSGIALGHPVGCTGLRIIVTLLHEMKKTGARLGCASLCAGGGPAMAAILEIA